MHNPESVMENETHKTVWNFGIQTDHLTSARRPDRMKVNKKRIVGFDIPADHILKIKESEKRDEYLHLV